MRLRRINDDRLSTDGNETSRQFLGFQIRRKNDNLVELKLNET